MTNPDDPIGNLHALRLAVEEDRVTWKGFRGKKSHPLAYLVPGVKTSHQAERVLSEHLPVWWFVMLDPMALCADPSSPLKEWTRITLEAINEFEPDKWRRLQLYAFAIALKHSNEHPLTQATSELCMSFFRNGYGDHEAWGVLLDGDEDGPIIDFVSGTWETMGVSPSQRGFALPDVEDDNQEAMVRGFLEQLYDCHPDALAMAFTEIFSGAEVILSGGPV